MAEKVRKKKPEKQEEELLENTSDSNINSADNSSISPDVEEKPSSTQSNMDKTQFSPFPESNLKSMEFPSSQEEKSSSTQSTSSSILEQNHKSNKITVSKKTPSSQTEKTVSEMEEPPSFKNFDQSQVDPIKKIEAQYEDLNKLEKHVITIAESVLKKKRYEATIKTQRPELMSPLVEELYEKCVAKLTHTRGYSREEIFETIQELHDKQWIITDQRRTRKEILESDTLKEVLDFIHKNPGTHARNEKIQEELSITRNPFIKHVMVLEAFGLIRSRKIGRTLNYFVTDLPDDFDEYVVLFSNPMVPEIIYSFIEDPGVSLSEIARQLDVYHGAIQYHVKKLKKMEILTKIDGDYQVNVSLLKKYNNMFDDPPFHKHF